MSAEVRATRERHLRALGVEPLRLRARGKGTTGAAPPAQAVAPVATQITVPQAAAIRRLALLPDPAELDDPIIRNMYAALTEAVGKAGLQRVRVCDVASDPSAAVMVFGAAASPEDVPAVRVLRAEALAVLHADRECKRLLWEKMQALGRGEDG